MGTSQSSSRKRKASDRSRSPTSQRGASPTPRPPPPSTLQQEDEPELKMAKDANGPIPMPPPASLFSTATSSSSQSQSTQSTDPQSLATDAGAQTHAPTPPAESAVRDPNTFALEKLEQIKRSLDMLEKEVDQFYGSTRNERAYKLLDEQALKIMIRCDELVDVSTDIKEKRKEMIRNVQRVIGKLESKVPTTPAVDQSNNKLETAIALLNESTLQNQDDNTEKKSSPTSSLSKENASASKTATEQSIST